jgi:hypothetical protein
MLGISIFSPALFFLWLTNIDADTVSILNMLYKVYVERGAENGDNIN